MLVIGMSMSQTYATAAQPINIARKIRKYYQLHYSRDSATGITDINQCKVMQLVQTVHKICSGNRNTYMR